jgi:hypothetical protein
MTCVACGHTHEGPELADICVGCPCPGPPDAAPAGGLTVEQATYLGRQLARLADAPSLNDYQRDAYRHAWAMLGDLRDERW